MPITALFRVATAFALMVPLTAAHPSETATQSAAVEGFDQSFDGFLQLPAAPPPTEGAVDLTTVVHTHEDADAPGSGKPLTGGVASYYGRQFDGRRTASGERFDMDALTAAHRTLPFGSEVRVTNPANGRSVVVRINDRGPFHGNRVIDVSRAAAEKLGLIAPGKAKVTLTLLD